MIVHIIHAFLGFTSTRLGSEVSRTLPRKNPEDPVRLKPRTPGLRVKHFTTEPRGTLKFVVWSWVKCLPTDKIMDWSKFKAFPDDKIIVNWKLRFALKRLENIVGKGENAGHQHFLLFPQCFQKASFQGLFKGLCGTVLICYHSA